MAFFEREQWMRAWLGDSADRVIEFRERMNAILEPFGRPGQTSK